MALFAITLLCSVATVAAQAPSAVTAADQWCYRARPRSECRSFFVTNSGPYVQMGALDFDLIRLNIDLGAMVNVSSSDAFGASWSIFGQSGDNVAMGPALRWRRWLGRTRSLDVAIGTTVFAGSSESLDVGSIQGLVKYNPFPWLGIAARPELIRYSDYNCTLDGCPPPLRETEHRLYLGAELGELSGLGLSVAAGVTVVVFLISFLASPDCCN